MKISIITPSYNMLPYLKCAAASIADQSFNSNETFEHLIMDAQSTDGTFQWLQSSPYPHLSWVSEKDKGMYDAINKGLQQATGDIIAYLNCDEQYLPGTLDYVAHYFKTHPQTDIIFGDALLIRRDGTLVAYRKGYKPRWPYILTSHLYVLSCTMFFRRALIEDGLQFDTEYRAVGDADFVVRVLRKGYKAEHLKRYMSAFTMTGQNLSIDQRAISEQQQLLTQAPLLLRKTRLLFNGIRWIEKFLYGAYFQKMPLIYSVYVPNTQNIKSEEFIRNEFSVNRASFRWRFE